MDVNEIRNIMLHHYTVTFTKCCSTPICFYFVVFSWFNVPKIQICICTAMLWSHAKLKLSRKHQGHIVHLIYWRQIWLHWKSIYVHIQSIYVYNKMGLAHIMEEYWLWKLHHSIIHAGRVGIWWGMRTIITSLISSCLQHDFYSHGLQPWKLLAYTRVGENKYIIRISVHKYDCNLYILPSSDKPAAQFF